MSKTNLNQKPLLIENITKDIRTIKEYFPNIIHPSIASQKLIIKKKIQNKKVIEYQNGAQFNILERKLKIKNGETFEGIINKKLKEYFLKKGIYLWPSGQKYIGSFNKENNFEGFGKLYFTNNTIFESEFSNGLPIKQGTFKTKLKDGTNIYIQSYFKNNKELKLNKIIFDGKTIIEKTKNNEKVYNFFGIFKNGKIIDDVYITKEIDNNRIIEIRAYFQDGKINGLLQMKDIKPGDTFQFLGEYKYGYRDGYFKIKDKINNIIINGEFHDINQNINLIDNILKKRNKNTLSFLKELHKKKLKELKYDKFIEKMKIVRRIYLKKHFIKIQYYLNQYKYLYKFNKNYKTRYNLDIEIIHLNKIKLGIDGINLLCKINFLNLKELSLVEVSINDFTPLKNSNFPKLKILSLGKNNISSIKFINILPYSSLENLMLGVNLIEDLSPLNNYKSNSIKVLHLLENKISDIKPLINMDTPNLEELYIGNNITDINPLINCKFSKLKQLSLSNNKIQNISPIEKYNFPNLELLILSNNQINKIGPLLKAKFPKLKEISLKNNLIGNYNILSKFPLSFNHLNKLDISNNKYTLSEDFNMVISSLKKKIKNLNY